MNTECISSDLISSLPENIIEYILSLMPIRDALRTSILSKKWRYSWCNMPKLEFTDDMVKPSSDCGCHQSMKYKLVSAIFHVLLMHNGPTILNFTGSVGMDSEFSQILSYLSRGNKVKELMFLGGYVYKLPISFFSLQELEHLNLRNCCFEPPLTFNGFSQLKSMEFDNVKSSAQMLQRFSSRCPLLEVISLKGGSLYGFDFLAGGNKFTFVDLFQCVPLIRSLDISKYYMKYLSAGGMPHKLPTSLVHLKYLVLDVKQNEFSSALCIIRSAQLLVKIKFRIYANKKLHVQENSTNFLDTHDHTDLNVDYLEILEIGLFSNLPFVMEFVKIIMAKSPVLKKVQINLSRSVSVNEEVKLLRDFLRYPLPRASPSAELIIKHP